MISDILDITKIERSFDSVNHCFLLQILQKFGFGIDFISWIKTILKTQEPCIINRGKTTKYLKLERGARQGDPIFHICLYLL